MALTMGHDQTVIQVLLGLGNDVGSSFNIVLEPTFAQVGLGSFCLPDVELPASLGITEGMNATLQVVTDGEGGGGLYNVRTYFSSSRRTISNTSRQCADITFTSTAPTFSKCSNGTGVTASLLPAAQAAINANMSSATGGAASGGSSASGSMSMSASGSAATATASPTGAANVLVRGAGAMGVAFLGVAALL